MSGFAYHDIPTASRVLAERGKEQEERRGSGGPSALPALTLGVWHDPLPVSP